MRANETQKMTIKIAENQHKQTNKQINAIININVIYSFEQFSCRAFFTARCLNKRRLCCRAVSVRCHSDTFVFCVETSKLIHTFSLPANHTILVFFPYQTLWQYSDGDLLTVASTAEGMKKIAIFDRYLALSHK